MRNTILLALTVSAALIAQTPAQTPATPKPVTPPAPKTATPQAKPATGLPAEAPAPKPGQAKPTPGVPAEAPPPAAKPVNPAPSAAAAAKAGAAVTVPSYKSLKFPALREVRIPEVTQFTLPNGMKVYMLENHELPLITGSVLVRTGNLFEPPTKIGLAGFTGSVMRTGGTKTRTGDQLDEELENMAASVESNIGETTGGVSFRTLKENVDQVLAIFKDVMINPEFREDKLDLVKTQARSGIGRRNDEPSGIAGREMSDIIYGRDNPYGWQMQYEHVDNIQRADLIEFHKRYFFPANMMLAVQGDFNTAEMRARIEKLFADWTTKGEPVPAFPQVTNNAQPAVYLAVKPDSAQTFFSMGHLGGILKDKDYPALAVASHILGGGFSSRLFTNVRTTKGLAYSIGGNWGANYNHPGLFSISGSTKASSTVDAIQGAKAELDRIRTAEVTDAELDGAKQSVLNSFVFFFDHPSKILNRLVTYEYYGYPKDFIFQYQKAVEGVTKADVLRVAKEHMNPAKLAVVAVGNPEQFGKPLSTLGEVKTIDLTIPEPKSSAAPAVSDAGSIERARKMLQRAQTAMGGTAKLAAINGLSTEINMSIDSPQGQMDMKTQNVWVAPAHFRQNIEAPFGKVSTYSDGKTGWMVTPQGTQDLPAPMLRQAQGEAFRNMYTLILSDRQANRVVNAISDTTVEITDKPSGMTARLEFDPSNGLPAKLHYRSEGGMGGGPAQVISTYSDYKPVSGIQIPHRVVIEQNGKKFAEGTISNLTVNPTVSLEELAKKP